jgi:WD40 repeat protein
VDRQSNSFGETLAEPLLGHHDSVWDLDFNAKGRLLASSSEDGTTMLWDVDMSSANFGRTQGDPLSVHDGAIFASAFRSDGETLVTGGSDHKIAVWNPLNLDSLQHLYRITPRDRNELEIYIKFAFSPDGEKIALSSWGGPLYLFDTVKFKSTGSVTPNIVLQAHSNHVRALAFSPDGKILASGDDDDQILLWNMDEASTSYGQPIGSPVKLHNAYIQNLEFGLDGKTIVSGDVKRTIRIWDVETSDVLDSLFIEDRLNGVHSALSPDGKLLVVSSFNGRLRVWEIDPGSASFGQQTGSPQTSHEGPVLDLQFNPEGSLLASAGEDGSIRLWDMQPESETFGQQFQEPLITGPVKILSLGFSPDGKHLVSGNVLGKVKLVELSSRKTYEIPGLEGFTDPVQDVSFSPDGSSLVVLFRNGTLAFIDFDLDSLQTKACARANRNLTLVEWKRLFGDEPYRLTCPGLENEQLDIGDEPTSIK